MPDKRQLQALSQVLHKLAGSAGTFGLPALSIQAAELDRQLDIVMLAWPDLANVKKHCNELTEKLIALGNFTGADDWRAFAVSFPKRQVSTRLVIDEVWLLEDDSQLGMALVSHLQAFNFSARLFTTFAGLQQAIAHQQPEILLLDVMLDGEGRSTECLQESELLSNLLSRIIFISAKD